MNRIALSILLASAALGPATSAVARAQAAARPAVAILSFDNNVTASHAREYDALRTTIAASLVADMAANQAIRVLDRTQVQQRLDEQGLGTHGQVDREVAVRVGRLLGAQHVIFGGYMADARGNVRIDARAVDVETGAIEYTDRVQDRADNMRPLVARLADRFMVGMKLPAATVRAPEPPR